jgi:hypothetical protein
VVGLIILVILSQALLQLASLIQSESLIVGVIEKVERAPSVQMGQILFVGSRNVSKYVAHHKQDSHSKK